MCEMHYDSDGDVPSLLCSCINPVANHKNVGNFQEKEKKTREKREIYKFSKRRNKMNYFLLNFFYYFILLSITFVIREVGGNLWTETARMSDLQQVYFTNFLKFYFYV